MKSSLYTIDYFIEKFNAIPDDKWCINHFVVDKDGYEVCHNQPFARACALGHCGMRRDDPDPTPEEAIALESLAWDHNFEIGPINDGSDFDEDDHLDFYNEKHPKYRVLGFLNWAKTQQK